MAVRLVCSIFLWLLVACGGQQKVEITLKVTPQKNTYKDSEIVTLDVVSDSHLDSVIIRFNNEFIKWNGTPIVLSKNHYKMGENLLVAEAMKGGKTVNKKYAQFLVKPTKNPKQWGVKVLRRLKHERNAFTQGLSYYKGLIYETTGENGHSRIIVRRKEDGTIIKSEPIADKYFGEGSTIFQNKLYYITWLSGEGFVFNAQTLEHERTFRYGNYTKQGWGLTSVGSQLVMSNGTEKLLFFEPQTMRLQGSIDVYTPMGKQTELNELEYDGKYIYANVWMKDIILVIQPKTGTVEAVIDGSSLFKMEKYAKENPNEDVLNGIAYNPEANTFYLTGKNWEYIYEVELLTTP